MEVNECNSMLTGGGKLLTEVEAAELLDLHPGTLRVWRHTGRSPQPKYIKIGKRNIRYRRCDVQAFLDSQTNG